MNVQITIIIALLLITSSIVGFLNWLFEKETKKIRINLGITLPKKMIYLLRIDTYSGMFICLALVMLFLISLKLSF